MFLLQKNIQVKTVMNRNLHYLILAVLLLLASSSLGFFSNREPARMKLATAEHSGKKIIKGAMVYEQNCKSCHGIRGEGIGQLGPALNDKIFFEDRLKEVGWPSTLESYITSTVDHGRLIGTRSFYAGNGSTSVMAAWHLKYGGPLRTDQIADLTAYILNWESTALGRVVFEEIEVDDLFQQSVSSEDGRRAFTKHCQNCHSFNELKSEGIGPDLSEIKHLAGLRIPEMEPEEYIKDSVLVPARYLVEGFEYSESGQRCGSVMSEKDLQTVVEFVLN